MEDRTRRRIVGGMGALAATGPMFWVKSAQAQTSFKPEKGAKLRVLRWKRFVQGDRPRKLGRRASQGGGGRQRRRRA
jgi:multiple sugar transport system substrate-binding protein